MTYQLVDLQIRPGMVTDETARGAEPYWKDCDHVRFRNGIPEKMGGWKKAEDDNGDAYALKGLARAIHDWSSLDGNAWIAVGTHKKLYLINSGNLHDITPLRDSGQLADPFTTTDTETTVNVEHTAHNAQEGDFVHFDNATAVGGITIDGEYEVTNVVDVDNYEIEHTAAATSSATGGGTVDYEYEISIGEGSRTTLFGYGVGPYGRGTWGTPRTTSDLYGALRIWSLDNWGEDLIASPLDGAVYVWDRTNGATTRAQLIADAPSTNKRVLVSEEDRHLICLGAHTGSFSDAMLVRWSDQEDYTTFTPAEGNTSGDKRLDAGSRIVTAVEARGEKIIFTDEALYSMRLSGGADVFAFYPLGESIRIASPNAAVQVNGVVYFMGQDDFFVYDGVVQPMPCPIRNHVFDDFNIFQTNKVYAAVNRLFNEIWFCYPSGASEENDRYAVYNYYERNWYFGTIRRTAMHDQSATYGLPYGVDDSGNVWIHESGRNDGDQALKAYIESHDAEVMDGRQMAHIRSLVPDFLQLDGEVGVTLKARRYPQSEDQISKGPYTVDATTQKIDTRIRNRQIAVRIESDAINDHWRMGTWRARVRAHGGR